MYKILKFYFPLLTLSMFLSSTAIAHIERIPNYEQWHFFAPYVCVDIGGRDVGWDTGFGTDFFTEGYTFIDGILGVQFHQNFAVEVGFGNTFKRNDYQYVLQNTPVLGMLFVADPLANTMFVNGAKLNGLIFNVVGSVPVLENTSVVVILGGKNVNLKLYSVPTNDDTLGSPTAPVIIWESGSKVIPRVGIGLQQFFNDNFGATIKVVWENTSKLAADTLVVGVPEYLIHDGDVPTNTVADNFQAKPKNSFVFTLGFICKFKKD